ncbi:MAG: hypothetical protein ACLGH0_11440 [Thermoanaerobaculia bacterium]
MRRISIVLVFLVLATFVPDAHAIRLGGERMIIPVIGRFPGVGGTQWRTDVFLANPYTPTVPVTIRFYPTGGAMQTRTYSIGAFSTLSLPDIVLNTFGMTNAAGPLEVIADPSTTEARARIYNAGNPAGQFGQNVPGIGFLLLNRQAYMYGLSGINGNRVNIGVMNPNDGAIDVALIVRNKTGTIIHSRSVNVGAHAYVQFNDIFTTFGIPPQDGVQVNFSHPLERIYGYASEVRNDTGDAVFLFGLSPNS